MSNKVYRILIVPERSSKVLRYRVTWRRLQLVIVAVVAMFAVAGFLVVHYGFMAQQAELNPILKDENIALKTRLRLVQDELTRIDNTLQRIDRFANKVRAITRVSDPDRQLAIGPLDDSVTAKQIPAVLFADDERIDYEDEHVDSKLAVRLINAKLERIESQSLEIEGNMRNLDTRFAGQEVVLRTTPSVRPVASRLLTSGFGMRQDPYTGQHVMHKGIDYATDMGSDVIATGDGIVVFAGNRGKYGKTVVVDHGYGMQTQYAHLSTFKVDVGNRVKRGQVIAGAGNTGLTTGVHLHYEVRSQGIPQDPSDYLLD